MFDFTWMSYYNSCPSVSGLFHVPQRALDPPTLFETIGFPSFLAGEHSLVYMQLISHLPFSWYWKYFHF